MTAAERLLHQRVMRRAAQLDPELAAAIMRAFARVRDELTETQILLALALPGGEERLFQEVLRQSVLDVAFAPVRDKLRTGVGSSFAYFARDIAIPPALRSLRIAFDILNPRVIDALRTMETRVITTLQEGIRETVRQHVQAGLVAGVNPRTTARTLRDVIGLAPNQEAAVRNYEAKLRAGASTTDYALRDKRFDRMKGPPTEEQITRMVAAYRKRMVAFNAETNARTASLDAMKLGQRLAWEDAVGKGVVQRDRLKKTWVGVMDTRERPEHRAMEGETTGFDAPFSNGEMIPGDSTFNCRCIARYRVA